MSDRKKSFPRKTFGIMRLILSQIIYCFACSPLGIEHLNQNACICDLTSHDDDYLT